MPNLALLILVGAAMFAFLGGVTLLTHIYNLNNIKRARIKPPLGPRRVLWVVVVTMSA